jgi:hypothetical protein
MYLFQRAKGSTSEVTPVQTCSKVTNLTPSLFPIVNDLSPYLLFLYLFQQAKGSTSEVAPGQTYSKVTNLAPFFLSSNQLQGPNMTWDPLLLDGSYQVNDASSRTN